MLRSGNDLKGLAIRATDGEVGTVDEFLFDDQRWAVRYMVVNTAAIWRRANAQLSLAFCTERRRKLPSGWMMHARSALRASQAVYSSMSRAPRSATPTWPGRLSSS